MAKLELHATEFPLLSEAIYTRQNLTRDLKKLIPPRLEEIYNLVPDGVKVEALVNALISKGLISRYDMLLSSAVSLAFKEDPK